MGSVRLDAKVFRDPRILILASELSIDKFSALGRLAFLWSHCTETCSYDLAPQLVNAAMCHERAAEALVSAELASEESGRLRIHGTGGRIEWLERKRSACRLGGQKRAEKAARNGGRFTNKGSGTAKKADTEQIETRTEQKAPSQGKAGPSPEALHCADHFRESILEWYPDCPDLTEQGWRRRRTKWAAALADLRGEKKVGWDKIRRAIDWSSQDPFWQPTIITPRALKKHFARMLGAASRPMLVSDHGHSPPTPQTEFPATGQEGIGF